MNETLGTLIVNALFVSFLVVPVMMAIFRKQIEAFYAARRQRKSVTDAKYQMMQGEVDAKAFKQAFLETYGPDAYRAKFGVGPEQDGLPLW